MHAGVRRRFLALSALAACGLGAVVAGSPAATGGTAATRLVDRTLTCRVGYFHGARLVHLMARSAARHGDTLDWLAHATVSTPGNPLSQQNSEPTLAGVTAGWPPPPPLTSGGLAYDNARCGPSRLKVALSPHGLTGGVASAFGEDIRCIVPTTVLVRVRATFKEPVEEQPNSAGDFVSALGRMKRGQVAVRTLAGKPVAYADVADGGRARVFTAKGCL
jgi:hypothetical protein